MAEFLELIGTRKGRNIFFMKENVFQRGKRTGEKKEERIAERKYIFDLGNNWRR